MSTYYDEAAALASSYREAVGWALQYGIKVYRPGTPGCRMKPLGDLREEIRRHELTHVPDRETRETYLPWTRPARTPDPVLVRAQCTNGHPATMWGSPVMLRPGERRRMWGSTVDCHCGAPVYGGPRR